MSDKVRIHDLAKKYGMPGRDLASKLRDFGFSKARSHMSALDPFEQVQAMGLLESNGIAPVEQAEERAAEGGGVRVKKRKEAAPAAEAPAAEAPAAEAPAAEAPAAEAPAAEAPAAEAPVSKAAKVSLAPRTFTSDARGRVSACWLPMKVVPNVEVTVETSKGMGLLERFAVEALLKLPTVGPDDLFEIATIPPTLGSWVLWTLELRGLATRSKREYAAVEESCSKALDRGEIPIKETAVRDCLWFPESEEVVVLRQGSHFLRDLTDFVGGKQKATTPRRFPMPPELVGAELGAVFRQYLAEGHCHTEDNSKVANLRTAVVAGEVCPAYRAQAELGDAQGRTTRFSLSGGPGSPGPRGASVSGTNIDLPVGHPVEHARAARDQLAHAEQALESWCAQEGGSHEYGSNEPQPRLRLPFQPLLDMAPERLTSTKALAEVVLNHSFTFELPVHVGASDEEGARLLELDAAIRRFLNDTSETIAVEFYDDALERMWSSKMFEPLYRVRSCHDFPE